MMPTHSNTAYCTFSLGRHRLGVEVERVQEVIRCERLTRVPRADSCIAGLMNLRGQIVTAIDLNQRLQLPDCRPSTTKMNVVIRTEDGPVSLLVDQIQDVIEVDAEAFEPLPETLRGTARSLLRGAYKLDRELLLVLDADAVLTLAG